MRHIGGPARRVLLEVARRGATHVRNQPLRPDLLALDRHLPAARLDDPDAHIARLRGRSGQASGRLSTRPRSYVRLVADPDAWTRRRAAVSFDRDRGRHDAREISSARLPTSRPRSGASPVAIADPDQPSTRSATHQATRHSASAAVDRASRQRPTLSSQYVPIVQTDRRGRWPITIGRAGDAPTPPRMTALAGRAPA